MALRHHPDKPGGDKEKFQNVKEAYDFKFKRFGS